MRQQRPAPLRPDFIVVRAMKSATTSLCDLLAHHPRISVSDPKEPEYFCRDSTYEARRDWYRSLFASAHEDDVTGEGSTSYTKSLLFPKVAERIACDLPDVKIIYIVRHPLDRIVSHWMHLRGAGAAVSADFNQAVNDLPHLLDTSLYWKQISCYRERFSEDQIQVFFFEDFRTNPDVILRQCQQFLGIEPIAAPADASQPRHRTAEKIRDHQWVEHARQMPLLRSALRRIPLRLREALRRRIGERMDQKPLWQAETKRKVVDAIAADARRFCTHYGKPEDFWEL